MLAELIQTMHTTLNFVINLLRSPLLPQLLPLPFKCKPLQFSTGESKVRYLISRFSSHGRARKWATALLKLPVTAQPDFISNWNYDEFTNELQRQEGVSAFKSTAREKWHNLNQKSSAASYYATFMSLASCERVTSAQYTAHCTSATGVEHSTSTSSSATMELRLKNVNTILTSLALDSCKRLQGFYSLIP